MFSTATATQSLALGWTSASSCPSLPLNTLFHLSHVTIRNIILLDGILIRIIFAASFPLASTTVAVKGPSRSSLSTSCSCHPFLVYGSVHLLMSASVGMCPSFQMKLSSVATPSWKNPMCVSFGPIQVLIMPSEKVTTLLGLPISNWLGVSPSSADAWHVANVRTATTMPTMGMAAIARGRMQFQKCSLVVLHLVYFMISLSF